MFLFNLIVHILNTDKKRIFKLCFFLLQVRLFKTNHVRTFLLDSGFGILAWWFACLICLENCS